MTTADKLRGLMKGATMGDWWYIRKSDQVWSAVGMDCIHVAQMCDESMGNHDARLIVAAVNLLPALAAVVEAGNAAVAKLRTLHYGEPVGRDDAKVVWDLKEALSALDAAVSREVG